MILKNNFQIIKLSMEGNLARIEQLMNMEGIDKEYVDGGYWRTINKDNVELRQRLKLLRKETLKLEKMLKG